MPPSTRSNQDESPPEAAAPAPFGDAPAPRRGQQTGPADPAKPSPGPSAPRQPRPALPPADPALQQRGVAALFIAMLSLVGLLGLNNLQRGVYVVLFALVAGVVALWLGVTAMLRARRVRTAQPRGALVATIVGALGTVMSGLLLLAFSVLGSQLSHYSQCLNSANTISSEQSCYTQFQHKVNHEISVLQSAGR